MKAMQMTGNRKAVHPTRKKLLQMRLQMLKMTDINLLLSTIRSHLKSLHGCTKEQVYQEILRIVRDSLDQGRNIPVSLVPEPRNPFNSNAIAFTCMVNDKWHRIGYAVNEILNEIHNALNGGEIVQVKFSWVKYISDWTRSGPGFFAGVSVTKRGYWSHSVTRAASTR